MAALFTSPHLIDVILVFTMIEAAILILWKRRRLRRPHERLGASDRRDGGIAGLGLMLLPGIFLMLALRAALAEAAWPWVPAALAAALVAHLLDLRSRWRG